MDTSFRFQGSTISLWVTPIGSGRWEVRSSQEGGRTFAYPTRDSALDIARAVARSQWEKWGFPCCIYLRERDDEAWEAVEYFGPAEPGA